MTETGELVSVVVRGRFIEVDYVALAGDIIRNALSIPDPQAHFRMQRSEYLRKTWDGRIHHFTPLTDTSVQAPLGLLPRLREALRKRGLEIQVDDPEPMEPIPYDHRVHGITLDPQQVEVCQKVLANRVASIELATSSGKTEIFGNAVACFHAAHPNDVALILVPKRILLRQTHKRLCARLPHLAPRIGMLGDGKRDLDCKIVVATPDTASAPKNVNNRDEIIAFTKKVRLLVLDEAHRSQSNKWSTVIERCQRPDSLIWAFSGKVTFYAAREKHKQLALEAAFGPPIHSGAVEERLCPVTTRVYHHAAWKGRFDALPLTGSVTHGTHVKWRRGTGDKWKAGIWRGPDIDNVVPADMLDGGGTRIKKLYGIYDYRGNQVGEQVTDLEPSDIVYLTVHDIAIMEFADRNEWAVDLCAGFHRLNQPFLVTVQRKRHARKLWNRFRKLGLPVGLVNGDLSGTEQEAVVNRLNGGALAGVVAVWSIMSEGVDVPPLIHLVKLDGLAGEQVLEQQKGRVQRIASGKERGYVHYPRDSQHKAAHRTAGRMTTYYKLRGIPVEDVRA